MRDVPPGPVPPLDAMGPSNVPTVEKEISAVLDGVLGGAAPVEEVLDQNDTPTSASLPSWDDIMEMLRRVPCFTDAESPSTKMSDFFPLTKRISVNLGGEPLVSSQPDSFSARPSSPYPVFSNCKIARCKRLRKW